MIIAPLNYRIMGDDSIIIFNETAKDDFLNIKGLVFAPNIW